MEVARLVWSLAIALGIAGGGYRKRSLDKSGAVAALVVGTLTLYASARAGALLISFFVTSSLVTRLGARTKKRLEADFKEGGGRDWHQVLSNSPATVLCVLMLLRGGETETLFHGYLAQLAAMQGDTWSSELGVLATRLPRLVTTGRPVPTGTNGGMTPEGTMAAVVGGAVLVVPLMVLLGSPATLLVWAASYALVGSVVDSLLGATLQYSGLDPSDRVVQTPGRNIKHICGRPLLDNHQVNLLTSLLMMCVGVAMAHVWGH